MQGNFITFEGVEGAGKSTILHLSAEYLLKEGFEVMTTREPGGIQLAEAIRAIILDRKNTHMDGRTEALLYAAARRQHLVEKVLPALAAGKLVLCDRFVDSSLAYQGYARGIGLEEVWEINRFAIEGCLPKLTIYFDLDPEIGLQRINNNQGREINRLDLETVDFHQRVREGYLYLTKHFPERMVLIDASGTIPQVFARVKSILQKRFLKL